MVTTWVWLCLRRLGDYLFALLSSGKDGKWTIIWGPKNSEKTSNENYHSGHFSTNVSGSGIHHFYKSRDDSISRRTSRGLVTILLNVKQENYFPSFFWFGTWRPEKGYGGGHFGGSRRERRSGVEREKTKSVRLRRLCVGVS